MSKKTDYIQLLRESESPLEFMKKHSGLPGPRSNLELLYAWVELSGVEETLSLLRQHKERVEINNPEEYILCCAVTALGKHIAGGHPELINILRPFASDTRWRIREGVAMALQQLGISHSELLTELCEAWKEGNNYELRAIVAGLCEPALLKNKPMAEYTIEKLVQITTRAEHYPDIRENACQTLIQALCYGWSVGIVYNPVKGKPAFEALLGSPHPGIRKIIRENLKKTRLQRMDSGWVNDLKLSLG